MSEVTFPLKLNLVDEDNDGKPDYAELSQETADTLYEYYKTKAQEEAKKEGENLLSTVTRVIEKILPLKLTLGIVSDLFAPPVDTLTAVFTAIFQVMPVLFITVFLVKIIEGLV